MRSNVYSNSLFLGLNFSYEISNKPINAAIFSKKKDDFKTKLKGNILFLNELFFLTSSIHCKLRFISSTRPTYNYLEQADTSNTDKTGQYRQINDPLLLKGIESLPQTQIF